jgi:broad specificity phosphatase PhoE
MTSIFLVRHGESIANADPAVRLRKDLRAHETPLSKLGEEEARSCGRALSRMLGKRPFTVFVSPYKRAQQTWQEIALSLGDPLAVIVDGRLREQEFKVTTSAEESKAKKDRARAWGKLYYRYKYGESGFDVLDRVGGFFNHLRFDLDKRNRVGEVVVICHEIVIRCFLMVALDLTPDAFDCLDIENCEVVRLQADRGLRFSLAGRSAPMQRLDERIKAAPRQVVASPTKAGGVVVDGNRVLVCKPTGDLGGYQWTFPKGGVDPGETAEAAAAREVFEETGYEAVATHSLGDHLGNESWCRYFLMRASGPPAADPDWETQEVRWVSLEEARKLFAATKSAGGRRRDLGVLDTLRWVLDSKAKVSTLPRPV